MLLPKGITGFWDVRDALVPMLDKQMVKSTLFLIKTLKLYKILNFSEQTASSNYFSIQVSNRQTNVPFSILVNAQYPYYCGVSAQSQWLNLEFINLPSDIRNCLDAYFEYLSPEYLQQAVHQAHLSNLSAAELKQIAYWDSKTLGSIIFNGYD